MGITKHKKVLITGITGFVGSHLAEHLLDNYQDMEVSGLLRWRSPKHNIQKIADRLILCYGDLNDAICLRNILEREKPDVIFHLAAQSYVDYSFWCAADTMHTNAVGTTNLLESVKSLKLQDGYDPVIHICSSSEVYGQVNPDEVPITENNEFRPASPYAVSKVAEDMVGLQYWLSWKIKTIRTRMFTHTGPRRGEVFVVSNFARQIARIECGIQYPEIKVGNLDSIRTFADVRDTVRAYWLLVNHCEPGEVYNIGGNVTKTVGEMLGNLITLSPRKEDIKVVVDPKRLRPSDVTLQIPCIDKFVKKTGWKPEIPFQTTLEDTLDYWREFYGLR